MVHFLLLQLSHPKLWAANMKCIFGQLIYYILEELIVRRLHFEYHSCGFLVYMSQYSQSAAIKILLPCVPPVTCPVSPVLPPSE